MSQELSVWETSKLLYWHFSFIARGAAENEQISRGHCRWFYSQQFSTCSFLLSQLWLLELINTAILGLAEEDKVDYLKLMVLLTEDSMMTISIQRSSWLNNLSLPFYYNGCLPWIFFEIALMNTNFLDNLPLITIKWQSMCSLLDNKMKTEYFTFRSCFIMCKLTMHM